jgi:hypothetical protein
MNTLALQIEKPISSAQSAASMANVVSLRRPGQRLGRRELVTGANGGRASNVARTPLSDSLSRWSGRTVAINDFAHTGRGGQAIEKHEALTTESEVRLTPVDLFATAFLFMSAASPPALVWLLLRTVS